MPCPAVMRLSWPGRMTCSEPRLSRWRASPARSQVRVCRPRWGWGPMPSPCSAVTVPGPRWSAKHHAPTVRRPRCGRARRTGKAPTVASRDARISTTAPGGGPEGIGRSTSSAPTGPLIASRLSCRRRLDPAEAAAGPVDGEDGERLGALAVDVDDGLEPPFGYRRHQPGRVVAAPGVDVPGLHLGGAVPAHPHPEPACPGDPPDHRPQLGGRRVAGPVEDERPVAVGALGEAAVHAHRRLEAVLGHGGEG